MSALGKLTVTKTRPCCYGFVGDEPLDVERGDWITAAQKPFRGSRVWLWGDPNAVLTSLKIGSDEQLAGDLPFYAMHQHEIPLAGFLALIKHDPDELRKQFHAAEVQWALARFRPHLVLKTANTGEDIAFTYRGAVQGVVLVGVEAL